MKRVEVYNLLEFYYSNFPPLYNISPSSQNLIFSEEKNIIKQDLLVRDDIRRCRFLYRMKPLTLSSVNSDNCRWQLIQSTTLH